VAAGAEDENDGADGHLPCAADGDTAVDIARRVRVVRRGAPVFRLRERKGVFLRMRQEGLADYDGMRGIDWE